MKAKINKSFVQSHQCEKAKENGIVLEQYQEIDHTLSWHYIKDSFFDSYEVKRCPFCSMDLPEEIYRYGEIAEVSLLIGCKDVKNDFDLNKTEVIQDILDNQNIIAYAEIAGDNVQIRWDEKVTQEELAALYQVLKKEYPDIKIGVYFKSPVKRMLGVFPLETNFLEMGLEEFLLSVKADKNIKLIS